MKQPNPAIVAQDAVRRLPRLALWLFCIAYVLPGFFGRDPWKSADMTAFGYMAELARGDSPWFAPQMMGLPVQVDALMPYWLGAWAIMATSWGLPADFSVRLLHALMLGLTLVATWYAVYYLARSPQAQPVAFAFGGEAEPADYARAMADGGLLASIACLGLAQLGHETTPASAQLMFTALSFYAFAALHYAVWIPAFCAVAGVLGLTFSGAPTVALLLLVGACVIRLLDRQANSPTPVMVRGQPQRPDLVTWGLVLLLAVTAYLATSLDLWQWRIAPPNENWADFHGVGRLLLWFTWPAWPLTLWTLWRWRWQLLQIAKGNMSRHLALPLLFATVTVGNTLTTSAGDRALLASLPALATLAAFALPTLQRGVASLIDWFTLVFFTGCAFVIWVVWIAMQTGLPPQPAANVARLVPGFQPTFSLVALLIATGATLAWAWLVKWRVGRHRAAIWKSMVLPAGGAALCWLLLMTLWLPLLNFARSYTALTTQISTVIGTPPCVETFGLDRGQIAAFQFHARLHLQPANSQTTCPWLLVDRDKVAALAGAVQMRQWTPKYFGYRPTDRDDDVLLFRRVAPP